MLQIDEHGRRRKPGWDVTPPFGFPICGNTGTRTSRNALRWDLEQASQEAWKSYHQRFSGREFLI